MSSLGPDLGAHPEGEILCKKALFSLVYQELYKLAQCRLKRAWDVETLSTTSLVNEAYIKICTSDQSKVFSREHFLALAATAMRQIVINYAEQKQAHKRGRGWEAVTYTEALGEQEQKLSTLIAIDKAIEKVSELDESLGKLIEMRFFSGMSEKEIADYSGISERTVRRNWKKAKALLATELE